MARTTIDQLCTRCRNETPHTEHVARLADRIFAAVQSRLELPADLRPLLIAAARLHDVGYAANQGRHAEMSAELVLRTSLDGITPAERRLIAAIILLHSGGLQGQLAAPLVRQLRRHPGLLPLASILRVADGLDHSHTQTTALRDIKTTARGIRLVLEGDIADINRVGALDKADLWQRALPLSLSIVSRKPLRGPSAIPIAPETPAREFVRRLLALQYRQMCDAVRASLSGAEPESLHDLRVAARRCRTLLRVARKPLKRTSAAEVESRLSIFLGQLGPLRDADVWVELLQTGDLAPTGAPAGAWEAWKAGRIRAQRRVLLQLRQVLLDQNVEQSLRGLARLVREELGCEAEGATVLPLAEKAFRKAMKKMRKEGRNVTPESPPRKLHSFRKVCRHARYCAEWFAPLFGKAGRHTANHLRRLSTALGQVHDCDMALEKLAAMRSPLRPRIEAAVLRSRRAAWARFEKEWRRPGAKLLLRRRR